MAKSNIYVGLEIGTSKICVVVGEARVDGAIKILGVGQAPSRGSEQFACGQMEHIVGPLPSGMLTPPCRRQFRRQWGFLFSVARWGWAELY